MARNNLICVTALRAPEYLGLAPPRLWASLNGSLLLCGTPRFGWAVTMKCTVTLAAMPMGSPPPTRSPPPTEARLGVAHDRNHQEVWVCGSVFFADLAFRRPRSLPGRAAPAPAFHARTRCAAAAPATPHAGSKIAAAACSGALP